MEKQRPQAPVVCFLLFFVIVALLYLPLIYLMAGSFLEATEEGWQFTFKWYQEVISDLELQEALLRSCWIAIGNAVLSTVLGVAAAIALAKSSFRFKAGLQFLSMVSLVMPELVFALSLLSWFALMRIPLSLVTVMIAHVSFTLSFVILTILGRLNTLDEALEEAAEDLGASSWQILWKITLPILKPALGTSLIMGFLLSFDDFLITFFTSGIGSDTLPVKLYGAMRMGHSPKLNALSSLMIVFSVLLIALIARSRSFRDLWRD